MLGTVASGAGLKPVFRPDGRITAGNCCPLNDGAAAVIIMSDSKARELGITVEEFQESLMKISNSTVVALDELWAVSDSSGDQVSLLDTLHDPDAPDPQDLLDASELKDRLADAISALPEREKLVIALYYYENLTLREIGEVLRTHRVGAAGPADADRLGTGRFGGAGREAQVTALLDRDAAAAAARRASAMVDARADRE